MYALYIIVINFMHFCGKEKLLNVLRPIIYVLSISRHTFLSQNGEEEESQRKDGWTV